MIAIIIVIVVVLVNVMGIVIVISITIGIVLVFALALALIVIIIIASTSTSTTLCSYRVVCTLEIIICHTTDSPQRLRGRRIRRRRRRRFAWMRDAIAPALQRCALLRMCCCSVVRVEG